MRRTLSHLAQSLCLLSLFLLSACSADLVVTGVKKSNLGDFHGIRVATPMVTLITKETTFPTTTTPTACQKRTEESVEVLPLGEFYDVTMKTGGFAKGEFSLELDDSGFVKKVSLNSTPQAADTLRAMAELTKAVADLVGKLRPTPLIQEANCGESKTAIIGI